MGNGVQAKMIQDSIILAAIKAVRPVYPLSDNSGRNRYGWATFWDIEAHMALAGVAFPEKVIREKLCRMVERGILSGCDGRHNCRGDFEIKEDEWDYAAERLRREAGQKFWMAQRGGL